MPPVPAPRCCPPLVTAALSEADAEVMSAMFKALADPVRLRLLSRVASHPSGEACVCDIADVGVSQPTVSHHLKKLREAGLLTSDRRGTWVYYRLAPGVLASLGAFLTETDQAGAEESSRAGRAV
ncbi:metalloregulator ArsR/SmtB family transcription factor [Streptomyces sp. NPDC006482]|uniref:ArsR/SmtB family transcription factor n=1 Tax=Streptomyces sp. NPDC006482 TaxID=3154306 RepID=UPI00339FEB1E